MSKGEMEKEKEVAVSVDASVCDGAIQEEGGVVPQLDGGFVSLVLAEGFPSWSFVLKSLGCKKIYTVTKGLTLEERDEVKNSRSAGRIIVVEKFGPGMQGLEWSAQHLCLGAGV